MPQNAVVPDINVRASQRVVWPLIEVMAVWACIGMGMGCLDRGDDAVAEKVIAACHASMSHVDLQRAAIHAAAMKDTWYVHGV